MRIEYKYTLPQGFAAGLYARVEIFLSRWLQVPPRNEEYRVESLYFDDESLSCYWDKKNGQAVRQKIRFRQYNETGALYLERKLSRGPYRDKFREKTDLSSFDDLLREWNTMETSDRHFNLFQPLRTGHLKPVTRVVYHRRAMNFASDLRVSLDSTIEVGDLARTGRTYQVFHRNASNSLSILEIKAPQVTHLVLYLDNELNRFRASNSKYCLAIEALTKRAI